MEKYLGESIAKLGFGLMRLPKLADGSIDHAHVNKMVDLFLERGFTYFDTAYVYENGESERAFRECVVKRYPREKVQLADKLPIWFAKEPADLQRLVDESLERCGTDYFDFYLLHGLNGARVPVLDEFKAWDFMVELKKKGIAKHIGFSFHDSAEVLDSMLQNHPEMEFVQLQINYADWESASVQSRKCYEVCRKHNKPVIIMEPVKGSSLAVLAGASGELLKAANPHASFASWAIRYCASLEGIVTVLSGMSNLEQMQDNTSYMQDFKPLNNEEREVLDKVVEELNKIQTVPCTACRYCVDSCPSNIDIPGLIGLLNTMYIYGESEGLPRDYMLRTRGRGKASECVACAVCESLCPQHINIVENVAKVAELYG